jgi:hypothetical protein
LGAASVSWPDDAAQLTFNIRQLLCRNPGGPVIRRSLSQERVRAAHRLLCVAPDKAIFQGIYRLLNKWLVIRESERCYIAPRQSITAMRPTTQVRRLGTK